MVYAWRMNRVVVIEQPRADVYTRPQSKQLVLAYYGAQDMAEAERKPPFFAP